MNGRERILNLLEGTQVDRVPLMPITMMFAGDQAGVDVVAALLVEGQAGIGLEGTAVQPGREASSLVGRPAAGRSAGAPAPGALQPHGRRGASLGPGPPQSARRRHCQGRRPGLRRESANAAAPAARESDEVEIRARLAVGEQIPTTGRAH